MKSVLFAISILCSTAYAGNDLEFSVSSNEQGNVHLITLYGSAQSGSELTKPWHEKARSLCSGGISHIEPQGQPLVRDEACGDAIHVIDGKQQCEVIRANVFG